jgi:23S rRNA (pseudouridine1915-N3)-methyltransferase
MKIKIIALGKIKEQFLRDGINEFLKRLTSYCTVEITELTPIEIKDENLTAKILEEEVSKRLTGDMGYMDKNEITEDWGSYPVQKALNKDGSPTERVIQIIGAAKGRNLVIAEKSLKDKEAELLKKGLQDIPQAPDTVSVEKLKEMHKQKEIEHECNK